MVEREKSCSAIVFRRKGKNILYLVLYKAASDHYREAWDFPKGNVEAGESEQEVATRETLEETGITKLAFIPGFRETIKFFYRKESQLVHKEIVFLLAETTQSRVKLSFEHQNYRWASYEETLKLLTYRTSREILIKAHDFLKEKMKQRTLI